MKMLNDVWNEISNGKTNFEPKKGHYSEQELIDFQAIVIRIKLLEKLDLISAWYVKSYMHAGDRVCHITVERRSRENRSLWLKRQ